MRIVQVFMQLRTTYRDGLHMTADPGTKSNVFPIVKTYKTIENFEIL